MRIRHGAPDKSVPALVELEDLADSALAIAQQIRETVAELRRQDTRGEPSDPAQ